MADRLRPARPPGAIYAGLRGLVRRAPGGKLAIAPWCAAQVIGFVLGVGLVYLAFSLSEADVPPLDRLEFPNVAAGETPFPLEAAGWLNGAPPSWPGFRGKVVVVDVWTYW